MTSKKSSAASHDRRNRRPLSTRALSVLKLRTWRNAPVVIAGACALVVGCRTESQAQPPAFPDLASYTPVNVADYTIELPNRGYGDIPAVYFLAPQGYSCAFIQQEVSCDGNIPGTQGGQYGTSAQTYGGIEPAGPGVPGANGSIQGHPIKALPPLHSITVNGAVCGVDDAGTTACKDASGRGFVLSPHGSYYLPHT